MKAGQLRECRSFLDHSVAESWESGSDFYAPGDYSLRIQRSQSERDLTGARKEGVKRAGGVVPFGKNSATPLPLRVLTWTAPPPARGDAKESAFGRAGAGMCVVKTCNCLL